MTVTAVALTSFSSGSLPELEPIQDVDVEFPVFSYVRILPECDFSPCQPDLKVEVIQSRSVMILLYSVPMLTCMIDVIMYLLLV